MPIRNLGGPLTERELSAPFTLSRIGRTTLQPEKTDNARAIETKTNCVFDRLTRPSE
jgi:hypothetical protein